VAGFTVPIGAPRVRWRLRTQQEQEAGIAEANGVCRYQSAETAPRGRSMSDLPFY
jgi:hypothetical protein